jgi:hypothetical protein
LEKAFKIGGQFYPAIIGQFYVAIDTSYFRELHEYIALG